jgi:hypothetical protein
MLRLIGAAVLFCAVAIHSQATMIGGVDFPQGAISFADAVVSYSPGLVGANPGVPFRGDFNALGVPNYPAGSCATQADCSYVSLGDGGSIVLRFVNNKLTGSGNNALDLWVFEIGPDVEDTFIDISTDGLIWNSIGKVFGSTAGIDIDAFGFGIANQFSYIRLTDDTNEGDQNGVTVGADIDAVGAISTIATPVPEPGTWALCVAGLLAAVLPQARRRATANLKK